MAHRTRKAYPDQKPASPPTSQKTSVYMVVMLWLSLYWIIVVTLEFYGLIQPTTTLRVAEVLIVIVFIVDYVVRFVRAGDKMEYFRTNIFALLSIFPPFALLRVMTLVHTRGYGRQLRKESRQLLRTNGFGTILLIIAMVVFFSAIALYHFERGYTIHTYFEAFYNTVITVATVGYGDFAPVTVGGRVVAIILSLFSIAFIGIVTGTLANFFFARVSSTQNEAERKSVLDLTNLTHKQKQDIADFIRYVKQRDAAEPSGSPSTFVEGAEGAPDPSGDAPEELDVEELERAEADELEKLDEKDRDR